MTIELTFNQIMTFLKADLKAGQTPALLGEPGIGKSALIEDLAKDFNTKVFTLPVNQLADRADLTGVRMTQNADGDWGQSFFPHETIMASIRYAQDNPDENPILFLDEFNRASSDITSAILSFQTLRRIGTINFPENLRLIVAGNDKGNVTSLDKASITRFSVYRVKPDIETFLSVQKLNPFVEAVMQKHPEDLLAQPFIETFDNDDDDDDNAFSLATEFLDEDGFEQATVPRTITYTSEWLTELGLDKSGSDEELAVIKEFLASSASDSENNVLHAGLVAHAGDTSFTQHVYDELQDYFNKSLSTTSTNNVALLSKFRPEEKVIKQLSNAQDVSDVSETIMDLSPEEQQSLLIWLFEVRSSREINNNDIVSATINELSLQFDEFDTDHMNGLVTIMANRNSAYLPGIKEFINNGTALASTYGTFISTTLGI